MATCSSGFCIWETLQLVPKLNVKKCHGQKHKEVCIQLTVQIKGSLIGHVLLSSVVSKKKAQGYEARFKTNSAVHKIYQMEADRGHFDSY